MTFDVEMGCRYLVKVEEEFKDLAFEEENGEDDEERLVSVDEKSIPEMEFDEEFLFRLFVKEEEVLPVRVVAVFVVVGVLMEARLKDDEEVDDDGSELSSRQERLPL